MPLYQNLQPYDIYLHGPGGEKVRIRRDKTVTLPEYFDKYVSKGMIARVTQAVRPTRVARNRAVRSISHRSAKDRPIRTTPVGRASRGAVVRDDFVRILESGVYPISNGIGVGILSYNRVHSLRRLLHSIAQHTDMTRTTVFVSDDASTCPDLLSYLDSINSSVVVLKNKTQLGIAGNTNRLMRCLSRFPNKLLLNDDVEITAAGWDSAYFDVMKATGMHHLCHRQIGVYGAQRGQTVSINGIDLDVVREAPHGAVLAFDDVAFRIAGYFDTKYGIYGMEHVDWSTRVHELGVQDKGFYDWADSHKFFKVHPEPSAVEDRVNHLRKSKELFANRGEANHVIPDDGSVVPSISCIVPFRDIERTDSIRTVIANLQAQRFPNIEIVAIEEDLSPKCRFENPIKYKYVHSTHHFNKSAAWNAGVAIASYPSLVLQDADMLSPGEYVASVYNKLLEYEACHLGAKVYYLDHRDTNQVIASRQVGRSHACNRCVDYYEGGSVGVRKNAYWRIGGFAEEFVGYGCEDCDFYARLAGGTKWSEDRTFNFVHLDHPRTDGWMEAHRRNLAIEARFAAMSIPERVARQRESLASKGYPI